jgi:hypothetical protein
LPILTTTSHLFIIRSRSTHYLISSLLHCIYSLAEARWARYQLSDDKEDLDQAIIHCTEAILLSPVSRDNPHFEDVIQSFFLLAIALRARKRHSEGLKHSIAYLRYLRGLHLVSFDLPRNLVTSALILALSTQVISDGGDATRNVKEMVVLCRELPTSNLLADFSDEIFPVLNRAIDAEYNRGHYHVESQATFIEYLRDAVKMRPSDSHPILYALAKALHTRFRECHSNGDYEEAMALLDRIMDPSGGCPDSIRDKASALAAHLALDRSTIFKNPEYSGVTISRLRALFASSSSCVDEIIRVELANLLALEASDRFRQYNLPESLEEAKFYMSQVNELSPSEGLQEPIWDPDLQSCSIAEMTENIQRLEELLSNTPSGTYRYNECLNHLADWYRERSYGTDDRSDLEESIRYCQLELEAAHPNDRGNPLISLQDVLFHAFEKTNRISYLEESIKTGYDILELKSKGDMHFKVVRRLVTSLLSREQLLNSWSRVNSRHEAIRLISTVIDDQYAREPDRFLLSCHWAVFARSIGHHTTLAAYKTAMSFADEALHLTAAMQYCGFRSVVGTMWAMADIDGQDLAKRFYGSLFSSPETGVPYYERSAHALRDATQELRRKRGIRLERWVNFVHYGA